MKKVAYIVDSATFLSEKQANEMKLHFLPLIINIGEEDYMEGVNLDVEYLYESMRKGIKTTTSQPSPGVIEQLIENLVKEGYTDAVFSGIASGLSKTQESVAAAGQRLGLNMHIIDSMNVGYAQLNPLLHVRYMVEEENYEIEEAISKIKADMLESKTILIVDDLAHLSKSGRMSSTAAFIGGMLQIKPVLQLNNDDGGKMKIADKVRTAKKAYKKMIDLLFEGIENVSDYVILLAQFDAKDAEEFVFNDIIGRHPNANVVRKTLAPTVGVHTGLNTVGVQIAKK